MALTAHYIIATWGGPRRDEWPDQVLDPTHFVAVHLAQLAKLRTARLRKITIAAPTFAGEPAGYQLKLEALATRHAIETGVPVEVLRRKNIGISYGSFSDAWLANRGKFEATIFCEDDQLPGVDDFDAILLDKLAPDVGYSAALVVKRGKNPPHAGFPLGAAREEKLEELAHTWGGEDDFALPHHRERGCDRYEKHEIKGQIPFTSLYPQMGLRLVDVVEDGFSVLFRARQWFERFDPRVRSAEKPFFCLPVEALGRPVLLPLMAWRRMRDPFCYSLRRRQGFSEDMERRFRASSAG